MIMRKSKLYLIIYVLTLIMSIPFLLACSSTSALKEGQQLFTGLKPIEYSNYEKSGYAVTSFLNFGYQKSTSGEMPVITYIAIDVERIA